MRPKQSPLKSGNYSICAASKKNGKLNAAHLMAMYQEATSGSLSRGRSRGRPHQLLRTAPFLSPLFNNGSLLLLFNKLRDPAQGSTLDRAMSALLYFLSMLCLTIDGFDNSSRGNSLKASRVQRGSLDLVDPAHNDLFRSCFTMYIQTLAVGCWQ